MGLCCCTNQRIAVPFEGVHGKVTVIHHALPRKHQHEATPSSPILSISARVAESRAPDSPADPPNGELVGWLESDVKEGDGLLLGLSQLLPSRRADVTSLLSKSLEIRKNVTNFQEWRAYINERFDLCTAIWSELLQEQRKRQYMRQKVIEGLEQAAKGLGDSVNHHLIREIKDLGGVSEADFFGQVSTLHVTISELKDEGLKEKIAKRENDCKVLASLQASFKRQIQALKLQLILNKQSFAKLQLRHSLSTWKQFQSPPGTPRTLQTAQPAADLPSSFKPPPDPKLISLLEADIREGDGLLLGLSQLLPGRRTDVASFLSKSLEIRENISNLDMCNLYIGQRYDLCSEMWTELLQEQRKRQVLRQAIIEGLEKTAKSLGTEAGERVVKEMRRLGSSSEEEFLSQVAALHITISELSQEKVQQCEADRATLSALQANLKQQIRALTLQMIHKNQSISRLQKLSSFQQWRNPDLARFKRVRLSASQSDAQSMTESDVTSSPELALLRAQLCDGNSLLLGFSKLFPARESIVNSLRESLEVQENLASVEECYSYITRRNELCAGLWEELLQEQRKRQQWRREVIEGLKESARDLDGKAMQKTVTEISELETATEEEFFSRAPTAQAMISEARSERLKSIINQKDRCSQERAQHQAKLHRNLQLKSVLEKQLFSRHHLRLTMSAWKRSIVNPVYHEAAMMTEPESEDILNLTEAIALLETEIQGDSRLLSGLSELLPERRKDVGDLLAKSQQICEGRKDVKWWRSILHARNELYAEIMIELLQKQTQKQELGVQEVGSPQDAAPEGKAKEQHGVIEEARYLGSSTREGSNTHASDLEVDLNRKIELLKLQSLISMRSLSRHQLNHAFAKWHQAKPNLRDAELMTEYEFVAPQKHFEVLSLAENVIREEDRLLLELATLLPAYKSDVMSVIAKSEQVRQNIENTEDCRAYICERNGVCSRMYLELRSDARRREEVRGKVIEKLRDATKNLSEENKDRVEAKISKLETVTEEEFITRASTIETTIICLKDDQKRQEIDSQRINSLHLSLLELKSQIKALKFQLALNHSSSSREKLTHAFNTWKQMKPARQPRTVSNSEAMTEPEIEVSPTRSELLSLLETGIKEGDDLLAKLSEFSPARKLHVRSFLAKSQDVCESIKSVEQCYSYINQRNELYSCMLSDLQQEQKTRQNIRRDIIARLKKITQGLDSEVRDQVWSQIEELEVITEEEFFSQVSTFEVTISSLKEEQFTAKLHLQEQNFSSLSSKQSVLKRQIQSIMLKSVLKTKSIARANLHNSFTIWRRSKPKPMLCDVEIMTEIEDYPSCSDLKYMLEASIRDGDAFLKELSQVIPLKDSRIEIFLAKSQQIRENMKSVETWDLYMRERGELHTKIWSDILKEQAGSLDTRRKIIEHIREKSQGLQNEKCDKKMFEMNELETITEVEFLGKISVMQSTLLALKDEEWKAKIQNLKLKIATLSALHTKESQEIRGLKMQHAFDNLSLSHQILRYSFALWKHSKPKPALHEAEIMTEPEIEMSPTRSDLVSLLVTNVREGDRMLLDFSELCGVRKLGLTNLMEKYQKSKDDIQDITKLCLYIKERSEMCSTITTELMQEMKKKQESRQQLIKALRNTVKTLKKDECTEESKQFEDFEIITEEEFITEVSTLQVTISGLKDEHLKEKLEEKERECSSLSILRDDFQREVIALKRRIQASKLKSILSNQIFSRHHLRLSFSAWLKTHPIGLHEAETLTEPETEESPKRSELLSLLLKDIQEGNSLLRGLTELAPTRKLEVNDFLAKFQQFSENENDISQWQSYIHERNNFCISIKDKVLQDEKQRQEPRQRVIRALKDTIKELKQSECIEETKNIEEYEITEEEFISQISTLQLSISNLKDERTKEKLDEQMCKYSSLSLLHDDLKRKLTILKLKSILSTHVPRKNLRLIFSAWRQAIITPTIVCEAAMMTEPEEIPTRSDLFSMLNQTISEGDSLLQAIGELFPTRKADVSDLCAKFLHIREGISNADLLHSYLNERSDICAALKLELIQGHKVKQESRHQMINSLRNTMKELKHEYEEFRDAEGFEIITEEEFISQASALQIKILELKDEQLKQQLDEKESICTRLSILGNNLQQEIATLREQVKTLKLKSMLGNRFYFQSYLKLIFTTWKNSMPNPSISIMREAEMMTDPEIEESPKRSDLIELAEINIRGGDRLLKEFSELVPARKSDVNSLLEKSQLLNVNNIIPWQTYVRERSEVCSTITTELMQEMKERQQSRQQLIKALRGTVKTLKKGECDEDGREIEEFEIISEEEFISEVSTLQVMITGLKDEHSEERLRNKEQECVSLSLLREELQKEVGTLKQGIRTLKLHSILNNRLYSRGYLQLSLSVWKHSKPTHTDSEVMTDPEESPKRTDLVHLLNSEIEEGNNLLEGLAELIPAHRMDVTNLLSKSQQIRENISDVQQCYSYLRERNQLSASLRIELMQEMKKKQESRQQLIKALRNTVKTLKKDESVEESKQFEDFEIITEEEFITEVSTLQVTISGLKDEHLKEKLEEKERECSSLSILRDDFQREVIALKRRIQASKLKSILSNQIFSRHHLRLSFSAWLKTHPIGLHEAETLTEPEIEESPKRSELLSLLESSIRDGNYFFQHASELIPSRKIDVCNLLSKSPQSLQEILNIEQCSSYLRERKDLWVNILSELLSNQRKRLEAQQRIVEKLKVASKALSTESIEQVQPAFEELEISSEEEFITHIATIQSTISCQLKDDHWKTQIDALMQETLTLAATVSDLKRQLQAAKLKLVLEHHSISLSRLSMLRSLSAWKESDRPQPSSEPTSQVLYHAEAVLSQVQSLKLDHEEMRADISRMLASFEMELRKKCRPHPTVIIPEILVEDVDVDMPGSADSLVINEADSDQCDYPGLRIETPEKANPFERPSIGSSADDTQPFERPSITSPAEEIHLFERPSIGSPTDEMRLFGRSLTPTPEEHSIELLEIHLRKIRREVEVHRKAWELMTEQFGDSVDSLALMDELQPENEDIQSYLSASEQCVKDVLRTTRESVLSLLALFQQVSPMWNSAPSPVRSRSEMMNQKVTFDSYKTSEAGNKETRLMDEINRLNGTISDKNSEIERLQALLTQQQSEFEEERQSVRGEISMLRLASTRTPSPCPSPSPSQHYRMAVSVSEPDLPYEEPLPPKVQALQSLICQLSDRVERAKRSCFQKWSGKNSINPLMFENSIDDSELSTDFDESHAPILEMEMKAITQETFKTNILLQVREKGGRDKPLTTLQLLKFFEEMMGKKYECDSMDVKNKRCPKSIPVFIMEYLTRLFGLRKLAIKLINQLIPTLEKCCKEKMQFAVLFARLAQVFHASPVQFILSVFLTKKMIDFEHLTEKNSKERSKPHLLRASKEGKHYSFTGGEAMLSDLLPYIYSVFDCDKRSGLMLVKLLKPPTVATHDYVLFHLAFKLTKIAISPDNLFSLFGDSGNTEEAVVIALRRSLDLWTTTEDLTTALKQLIGPGRAITKKELSAKVNHRLYQKYAKREDLSVSKFAFLLALTEVYQAKERVYFSQIKSACEGYPANVTFEDFRAIVRKLDPTVPQTRIIKIFQFIAGKSHAFRFTINHQMVLQVLERHPVGVMARSAFCEDHVGQKELLDLFQDSTEETGKSVPVSPMEKPTNRRQASMALFSKSKTPLAF